MLQHMCLHTELGYFMATGNYMFGQHASTVSLLTAELHSNAHLEQMWQMQKSEPAVALTTATDTPLCLQLLTGQYCSPGS